MTRDTVVDAVITIRRRVSGIWDTAETRSDTFDPATQAASGYLRDYLTSVDAPPGVYRIEVVRANDPRRNLLTSAEGTWRYMTLTCSQ